MAFLNSGSQVAASPQQPKSEPKEGVTLEHTVRQSEEEC